MRSQLSPHLSDALLMILCQHLKSKCLVVDNSNESFEIIKSCLRKQGVAVVEQCENLRHALSYLETEEIPWIISATFATEKVNILQLLSIILKYPALRSTYVSLIFKQDEIPIVLSAFELGLLSCHPAFEHGAQFDESLSDLWRKESYHRSDFCSIAADYVSDILVPPQPVRKFMENHDDGDQKQNIKQDLLKKELLKIRQNLVETFPGHMEHLLRLAESKAILGEEVNAASTLMQVKMIAPSLHYKIEEIRAKYLPQIQLLETTQKVSTNVLGIHKAVIVDPDPTVLKSVAETLDSLGAKGIETFTSSEEALAFLKNRPDLDILIHEWKMPKISGPVFIQKVRQMGLERTPVILCSSQVADRDQNLTRELGIATVVRKPFKKKVLLESIIWTMKQEHRPTEIRIVERKIQGLLSRGSLKKAYEILIKLRVEKKLPEASFGYFEAELLFSQQKYDSAKATALEALRKGFTSVRLYHLMGKILMKLGDFEAAIRFLEKAQELSPHNVLRLCLLADAHTELGKLQASRANIDQAGALDPQNPAVLHSEITFSLSTGELKKAEKIFQNLEFFDEIISYLNSRAVALSRCGRHQEAIDCYQKALQCLPSKAHPVLGSLFYNLSLAQIRAQELAGASKSLKTAEKLSDAHLYKKAHSLRLRLHKSLNSNQPFVLKSADQTFDKDPPESLNGHIMEILTSNNLEPGDYGLYKIFVDPILSRKLSLSRSIPRFCFKAPNKHNKHDGLKKAKAQ